MDQEAVEPHFVDSAKDRNPKVQEEQEGSYYGNFTNYPPPSHPILISPPPPFPEPVLPVKDYSPIQEAGAASRQCLSIVLLVIGAVYSAVFSVLLVRVSDGKFPVELKFLVLYTSLLFGFQSGVAGFAVILECCSCTIIDRCSRTTTYMTWVLLTMLHIIALIMLCIECYMIFSEDAKISWGWKAGSIVTLVGSVVILFVTGLSASEARTNKNISSEYSPLIQPSWNPHPAQNHSNQQEGGDQALAAKLRMFYSTYNPAKVAEAESMASKYAGREQELNALLLNKYQNQMAARVLHDFRL